MMNYFRLLSILSVAVLHSFPVNGEGEDETNKPYYFNMSMEYGDIGFEDVQLICLSGSTFGDIENKMDKVILKVKNGENLISNVYVNSNPTDRYRGYCVMIKSVVEEVQYANTNNLPVWFVFDGLGCQWVGMADELMKIPICNETFRLLHGVLKEENFDLFDTLRSKNASIFDDITNAYTSITAVQLALVDFLNSVNVHPGGIIGHSAGEIVCAYVDGALSAEQAIMVSYYRGRSIIEANVEPGGMAIIGLSEDKVIKSMPKDMQLHISAHNSEDSVMVSGSQRDIKAFVNYQRSQKVFARELDSAGFALHSDFIKEAGPIYLNYLKKVIKEQKHRTERWITTIGQKSSWDHENVKYCGPEYFVKNMLGPIYFYEATMYLPRRAVIMEVGPHNVLQANLKRNVNRKGIILSLLRKANTRNLAYLMASIGRFFVSGGRLKATEPY